MTAKNREPEGFELFWEAYGYKVGKKGCAAIWRREKLECMSGEIIASIPAYDAFLQDNAWLNKKHPSTWLNGAHWDDQFPATKPQPPQNPIDAIRNRINGQNGVSPSGAIIEQLPGESWSRH